MYGDLVDRLPNIDRTNNASFKDALAQPLELKDCLKIRDGLVDHKAHPATGWPQFKIAQLTSLGLNCPWINNN